MLITFVTYKESPSKNNLVIAFTNYTAQLTQKPVKVYDFNHTKTFYSKWINDGKNAETRLYNVAIGEEQNILDSLDKIALLKFEDEINIIDLTGGVDKKYIDFLHYSDVLVIPFDYSSDSTKETLVFSNLLKSLNSNSFRVYIKSDYEKGFTYPNEFAFDPQLYRCGYLIESPVYNDDSLETINTCGLTLEQENVVQKPFTELLEYINETLQVTI